MQFPYKPYGYGIRHTVPVKKKLRIFKYMEGDT